MIFISFLMALVVIIFQPLNAQLPNIQKQKQKWRINSIEKARDIRQFTIPFEYSKFYKIELVDDTGEEYSIILCKTAEEWEEEAKKLKKKAIKDKVIADIEAGVSVFELSHGEVVGGAIAGGMSLYHNYEAYQENKESKEAYKNADEERKKEETQNEDKDKNKKKKKNK